MTSLNPCDRCHGSGTDPGTPDRWADLKRYLEGIRAKAAANAADTTLPERARFEQDTQARSMEFALAAMAAMEASGR